MCLSQREFTHQNGKPDDRTWLDHKILYFISARSGVLPSRHPKSEREIYEMFAPIHGPPIKFGHLGHITYTRSSWSRKARRIKRAMIAAALRRLISTCKIRIHTSIYPNRRSMRETVKRRKDVHLFGSDHDGVLRNYAETNVLQAIVDAIEVSE